MDPQLELLIVFVVHLGVAWVCMWLYDMSQKDDRDQ